MEIKLLEQNIEMMAGSFQMVFETAWGRYQILQGAKKKGALNTVQISFLRTGVLLKTAWFQIDLLDEDGWGALEECCEDWEIGPILNDIYESTQENNRISTAQREKQLLAHAEQFAEMFQQILPAVIRPVREEYPQVQFRFGEYMGTSQTI